MIETHKNLVNWFKKKFNVSNYGLLWVSFIKGLIFGLVIYHFFIK